MSLTSASPLEAAQSAKDASRVLATLPTSARNDALTAIHAGLSAAREGILAANARDLAAARAAAEEGRLSPSLVSRLDLGKPGKWEDMLRGILDVRGLDDPVGRVTLRTRIDDGLDMERVTCPIGVLLIIFEARPEVIANIASLAVKSGNAAILKGGKESTESFIAISTAISAALALTQVPSGALQLVTTRDAIPELLAQDRNIDLVIPRGSNELVRYIKSATRIPVLGHADGLCSMYLDAGADEPETAARLVLDSKTSYPAACNSLETLLVHESLLPPSSSSSSSSSPVLTAVVTALAAAGVEMRCDPPTLSAFQTILAASPSSSTPAAKILPSTPEDYDTEFLSLTLAVAAVADLGAAVSHVNAHGSGHTDAIVTSDPAAASAYLAAVDAAGVYHNASTRMADGMRYGFGTEVGISTNKIHSRGPVGLEGLMIYKYLIRGSGQATADYGEGEGKRRFKHETLPL